MKTDEELRASLREPHDEARARDNWKAIQSRRRGTPSVPWSFTPRLALGVGALALAAAVLFVAVRPSPGPLRREGGAVAAGMLTRAELASGALSLDDGSVVSLDETARLEVLENAGDHVRFWLHDGSADFDVVPGGPRRWLIESGVVTVEVLGTSFRVTHREHEVEVSVSRGSVLVRGPTAPGGMQRLHAGDSIVVPLDETHLSTAEPEATREHERAGGLDDAPIAPSTEVTTEIPMDPAPEAVAAVTPSRTPRRIEAPETAPEATPTPALATAQDRLRDADRMRASGQLEDAARLLSSIVDDTSAGSERALAAFTLGRLELDRRGRPREAADAFARAIDLGLRAPLLEDARARRVQALSRVDRDAARRAADEYLAHHPDGRWRTEIEAWIATP